MNNSSSQILSSNQVNQQPEGGAVMNQAISTSTAQRALWLTQLGCSPIPVAPLQSAEAYPAKDKEGNIQYNKDGSIKPLFNGKNPSFLDAAGKPHLIKHTQFRDSQPTAEQLKEWFANPANGIGTLAGQGGIDWIDLDRKNFPSQEACDNARAQILEKCDRTYFESTRSGGAHIAVKLSKAKTFTNFELGPDGQHAGEFLGQGRFVVLSPTPGYVSQNGDQIASVQSAESLGLAKVGSSKAAAATPSALTAEPASGFEKDMGKPPVAIERLISKKTKQFIDGGKPEDISSCIARIAREVFGVVEWYPSKGLPVSGDADGFIRKVAEKWGVDGDRLKRILEPISRTGNIPALVKHGGENAAIAWFRKQRKSEAEGDEVCSELKKIRELRAYYEGRVRFNQLSQKIEVDSETVDDIEGERIYYVEKTNKSIGVDLFCSILRVIATENNYHPVGVYLEDVAERCDSDPAIFEGIAERYFGVDDPTYSTYVKRWMMSAVKRVLEPGCKVDTALFLVGPQGKHKKSTFFETIAGKEFFSDALGDAMANKDEIMLLSKFWVHEWSELENVFRKKEVAAVKAFMARKTDTIRPPYRRDLIDLKRSCVFCGSTNETEFLSDSTGDRRFWVIPTKAPTPIEMVKEERDRLWAAAVKLVRDGEQWWLTPDEEVQQAELNKQFRSLDPWHQKIELYLSGKQQSSANEVLTGCFEYELKNISRRETMRVASVFRSLGWENAVRTVNGKKTKVWVAPLSAEPVSEEFFSPAQQPEPVQQIQSVQQPVQPAEPMQPTELMQPTEPMLTSRYKPGDKVMYVGTSPSLKGLPLTVLRLRGSRFICEKADGGITPDLKAAELKPLSDFTGG